MSSKPLSELMQAYRATRYVALERGREVVVAVDRMNPGFDAVLEARGAGEGVFITAHNPGSARKSDGENAAASKRLKDILADEELEFITAEHRPPTGSDWPVEKGFVVFDLPPSDALALAEMFGQNAILWAAFDQPAQILSTKLAVD